MCRVLPFSPVGDFEQYFLKAYTRATVTVPGTGYVSIDLSGSCHPYCPFLVQSRVEGVVDPLYLAYKEKLSVLGTRKPRE